MSRTSLEKHDDCFRLIVMKHFDRILAELDARTSEYVQRVPTKKEKATAKKVKAKYAKCIKSVREFNIKQLELAADKSGMSDCFFWPNLTETQIFDTLRETNEHFYINMFDRSSIKYFFTSEQTMPDFELVIVDGFYSQITTALIRYYSVSVGLVDFTLRYSVSKNIYFN